MSERSATFIKKHGHDTLWSYLRATPNISLIELAEQIGDVTAAQLQSLAVDECFTTKQLGALIRDLLARNIHRELPNGWGSENDFAHVMEIGRAHV